MKEQVINLIKKTDKNSIPLMPNFVCIDCPSAGWTSGLTREYLIALRNNFEAQLMNIERDGFYTANGGYEAVYEATVKEQAKLPYYFADINTWKKNNGISAEADEDDILEDYEMYKDERTQNAEKEIRQDKDRVKNIMEKKFTEIALNKIWSNPENEKNFIEYVEEQKRNSLNCYCKEQHQFTYKSEEAKYIHILDCQFKEKLEESQRINSAMNDFE